MRNFKKIISCICASFFSLIFAGNIFAVGYKAQLSVEEHYRKGSGDFHCGFSVENDKGVTTYCVNVLKHNSAPAPYDKDLFICHLCRFLLNECKKGKFELNKLLNVELSKDSYLKLFNLTKIIKSKNSKDSVKKTEAFKELLKEIFVLYDVNFSDECIVI